MEGAGWFSFEVSGFMWSFVRVGDEWGGGFVGYR